MSEFERLPTSAENPSGKGEAESPAAGRGSREAKMETLSRRHRLRQQQQQQQQQQDRFHSDTKSNSNHANHSHSNHNHNHNLSHYMSDNGIENEPSKQASEHFRVVRANCNYMSNNNNNNNSICDTDRNGIQEYNLKSAVAATNLHLADDATISSGFASASSSGANTSSTSSNWRPSTADRRVTTASRLIEDLDRLLQRSPSADSTLNYLPDSTLTRGSEIRYSTLCRDEFSTFIGPDQHRSQQSRALATRSPPLDADDHADDHDDCGQTGWHRSNSANSSATTDSNALDTPSELLDSASSPSDLHGPLEGQARQHDGLSELLDGYLARVHALLRLSSGDRSVSMREAFGQPGEQAELEASEHLRTKLEYKELHRPHLWPRVVQTIDWLDERQEVRVQADDFRALLSAPQTSPSLDWQTARPDESRARDPLGRLSAGQLQEEILHRLESLLADTGVQRTAGLRRQVEEFVGQFGRWQRSLRELREFDWRQNFLFAHKRVHGDETSAQGQPGKRARRMVEQLDERGRDLPLPPATTGQVPTNKRQAELARDQAHSELFTYSTIILSGKSWRKRLRLDDLPEIGTAASKELDEIYQCQLERSRELRETSLNLRNQVDVCQLLISDTACQQANNSPNERQTRDPRVGYHRSDLVGSGGRLRLSAGGYLFEFARLSSKLGARRRRQLRERLTDKLMEMFRRRHPLDFQLNCAPDSDRVRFSVGLDDVELSSRLPAVQLCAKFTGALPISVRWFRRGRTGGGGGGGDDHGDDLEELISDHLQLGRAGEQQRQSLSWRRKPSGAEWPAEWPLSWLAEWDFEYPTGWLDLQVRFRRHQDDVMLELRSLKPPLSDSLDLTFRCELENYCSRESCTFRVRRTQPDRPSGPPRSARRAVLRTWSQRTLHRPPPSTSQTTGVSQARSAGGDARQAKQEDAQHQLAIGRMRAAPTEHCEFDENFAYHPANLLRRLEQNKLTVGGTLRLKRPASAHERPAESVLATSAEENFSAQLQFNQLQEDPASNFDKKDEQPVRVRVPVAPKPRSRLVDRQTVHANHPNQSQPTAEAASALERQLSPQLRTNELAHDQFTASPSQGFPDELVEPARKSLNKGIDRLKTARQTTIATDIVQPVAQLATEGADERKSRTANVRSLISRFSVAM